ncbi:hypothetical protein SKAU_G00277240 [Synaphobranchus kaupii]|uniref:Uncharacterized protein n=1 Tax=Synaphobranchus kaupii TaxID=118154 RepID=A0A9Q1F1H0_SYNKA|nr:hypothetical protein SKAU_G00277240 [Synaphobranchus kaupii]
MAAKAKLRKFKYDEASTTTNTSLEQSTTKVPKQRCTPPNQKHTEMDVATLKAEILTSLRTDICSAIREEMKRLCGHTTESSRTSPASIHGEPVAIYPDYMSSVAKARASFTDVRKLLRGQQGIRYGFFFPAKLRITHNNEDREFLDPDKAMDYVKRNIAPTGMTGETV